MDCVRVVCPVHQDGVRVVVDGNIDYPAGRQLDARRGPAAPGEAVHNDFFKYVDLTAGFHSLTRCSHYLHSSF